MLAAVLLSAGIDARYWTKGDDGSVDVSIALDIVQRHGLNHRVANRPTQAEDGRDPTQDVAAEWESITREFVHQTDGLASIFLVGNIQGQPRRVSRLEVTLVGHVRRERACDVRAGLPVHPRLERRAHPSLHALRRNPDSAGPGERRGLRRRETPDRGVGRCRGWHRNGQPAGRLLPRRAVSPMGVEQPARARPDRGQGPPVHDSPLRRGGPRVSTQTSGRRTRCTSASSAARCPTSSTTRRSTSPGTARSRPGHPHGAS